MLTENDFKLIEKQASKLYGDLELEIIQEIAERIASVGYANTVVYNDAKILQEMGTLYEDVILMVAEHSEKSYSQIYSIFQEAGIKSLKYDDTIYKLAGLSPKGLSKSMEQLLSATARRTNNNLNNLTMTTAATSQTQFLNAMNKAYMEVSTGVKSYSISIIDTIREISNQGAYVEYPSGAHRSLESAVRTNIITSVNQTSGKLQELRAEEMDWDLVEVSAHGGARPEHAEWQGKVYSLRGETKGYKTLEEGCDYGRVTGLCGANCRHTFFPYYKGSVRTYTNQELYELKNETVEYNGQKISKYDATQIQRKMERNIRQNKKDIAGLQGILASNNSDIDIEQTRKDLKTITNNLKTNNGILNDFINQTGFKKDNNRLFLGNTSQIEKKIEDKKYIDITETILSKGKQKYILKEQKYFVDKNGEKYKIDGRNVMIKANEKERKVANLIGETYGGQVRFIPVVLNPQGIKTPDYTINGEKFDLKEIFGNSKNTLYNAINKKKEQSTNFIFDISNTKMKLEEAIEQIQGIYKSKHKDWVGEIILIKDNKVIKIFKRK